MRAPPAPDSIALSRALISCLYQNSPAFSQCRVITAQALGTLVQSSNWSRTVFCLREIMRGPGSCIPRQSANNLTPICATPASPLVIWYHACVTGTSLPAATCRRPLRAQTLVSWSCVMCRARLTMPSFLASGARTYVFCVNDSVGIDHGIGKGETGSVISIESLAPEVTHSIELSSRESAIVSQNSGPFHERFKLERKPRRALGSPGSRSGVPPHRQNPSRGRGKVFVRGRFSAPGSIQF